MIESYRLLIVDSPDNPNSFELHFSANHKRGQMLVVFQYEAGQGVAERLKIEKKGRLAVKITKISTKDNNNSLYSIEATSPQLGPRSSMAGEYSVNSGKGFLNIRIK